MTILNLEWNSFPSRDRESSTLVCNYLRYQNHKVIEGCIYNAFWLIFKYKPDAIYMSNTIGSSLNFKIAEYIYNLGIPLYSSHAEGDFPIDEKDLNIFVWGHNHKKVILETKIYFWSERNANLTLKYFNNLKNYIYVSGSPGHDKYIIEKKIQDKINCKRNINFNNISIACFEFGFTDINHSSYNLYKEQTITFFKNQMFLFDKYLSNVIQNNPDKHFYIKQHPINSLGLKFSGVENSSKHKNVTIIDKKMSILEFLSISDITISYQSNTSLELWLLGKNSVTLNPDTINWPIDFYRTPFHKCQPIALNANDLNELINDQNKLLLTDQQKENKKNLIKDIICYDDGLNHVRIGNNIINENKKKNKIKKYYRLDFILLFYTIVFNFKNLFSLFKNKSYSIYHMLEWNEMEIKIYQKNIFKRQIIFYRKLNLTKNSLSEIFGKNFTDLY